MRATGIVAWLHQKKKTSEIWGPSSSILFQALPHVKKFREEQQQQKILSGSNVFLLHSHSGCCSAY
jgi:hypothetical protein